MMVSSLASNSPASKMGFRKGQVITAINNEPVTDQKDINQAFRKLHTAMLYCFAAG
jgi:S1-C subfamily serine protease